MRDLYHFKLNKANQTIWTNHDVDIDRRHSAQNDDTAIDIVPDYLYLSSHAGKSILIRYRRY